MTYLGTSDLLWLIISLAYVNVCSCKLVTIVTYKISWEYFPSNLFNYIQLFKYKVAGSVALIDLFSPYRTQRQDLFILKYTSIFFSILG